MHLIKWEHNRKVKWALLIALVFHVVGFVGIVWIDQPGFVAMTPYNLLLSLVLIFWTHDKINLPFFIFFLVAFQTGFFTEYLGVNRQLLFGFYQYEEALGPKLYGVPFLIGVNWFMIVYCCAATVRLLLDFIWTNFIKQSIPYGAFIFNLMIVVFGAFMAMSFDWVMEPVAIKLGYWTWLRDGAVPVKNYWDWFFVSAFLILIFINIGIYRKNLFAFHLLWIQSLFFISLRFLL
jgi:putative membrane protein